MAAAIKSEFSLPSNLIPGTGGVFDVTYSGKLIFSKHEMGRFPAEEEILDLIHKEIP